MTHPSRKENAVTVTGKLTRRDLAQTMPVHADPLHFESASFRGVNQVTFSYRTPTDAAAKLLPAALVRDRGKSQGVGDVPHLWLQQRGPIPRVYTHHSRSVSRRRGGI